MNADIICVCSKSAYTCITMMRNTGKEWNQHDLMLLGRMVRDRLPMRYMRTILGRSENAIANALRNTIFHQLLMYSPEQVAERYGYDVDQFASALVPAKYNVPLPDESSEIDGLDSYHDITATQQTVPAFLEGWFIVFATFCIGGIACYVHTLSHELSCLTHSS